MLLTGPTTVGKSDVAQALAAADGYEMVNVDKFYFYHHPGLATCTGMADSLAVSGIQRHLYGTLDINDTLPTPKEYLQLARRTVDDIQSRGGRVLLEGCSRSYNMVLISSGVLQFRPFIGLEWEDIDALVERIGIRTARFFQDGLVEETEQALAGGLADTYIMRKSCIYQPAIDHLRGNDSFEACQKKIRDNLLRIAQEQHQTYRRVRGIHWIKHDPSNLDATIDAIRKKIRAPRPFR